MDAFALKKLIMTQLRQHAKSLHGPTSIIALAMSEWQQHEAWVFNKLHGLHSTQSHDNCKLRQHGAWVFNKLHGPRVIQVRHASNQNRISGERIVSTDEI